MLEFVFYMTQGRFLYGICSPVLLCDKLRAVRPGFLLDFVCVHGTALFVQGRLVSARRNQKVRSDF